MHFYLWWSPQGGPRVADLEMPSKSIIVRAVRHHDEHSPLLAGRQTDYHQIGTRDVVIPTEDALGPSPITEDQRTFVDDSSPVRVLLGRPGAGKTTALLNAIFTRSSQRVLYVTWSERLCEAVRQQSIAFAPRDTYIEAIDFTTLLARILGRDLERQSLLTSISAFDRLMGGLSPAQMGVWATARSSLFAEVRAYLFGRARAEEQFDSNSPLARLSLREYRKLRRQNIGDMESEGLVRIVDLCERNGSLADIFPELKAAHEAVFRLRTGHLPEGYERFHKLAVDEAQDLTGIETDVLVELCKAVARANDNRAPSLLVACDEGQTVRPSGFSVGELRRRLEDLRTPSEHKLAAALRYPREISQVIERAQSLYGQVARNWRPANQVHIDGGGHVNGQVRHVSEANPESALKLLRDLVGERSESVLIVAAGDLPPTWLDESLLHEVLLPHEAKGLEYQTVVVLDPGRVLVEVSDRARPKALRDAELRSAIDRLRVAMTRATETLVFLDVAASAEEEQASRMLLGQAESLDGETAIPTIVVDSADDETLDDRVQRLVDQSRNLRDIRPDSAWRRVYHAMELLGDRDRPQGVTSSDIRIATYREVCGSVIRSFAQGEVPTSSKVAVSGRAAQGLGDELGRVEVTELVDIVIDSVCSIEDDARRHAIRLLEAVCKLGDEAAWVQAALTPITETLRQSLEAAAGDKDLAESFASSQVVSWLAVVGNIGDPNDKVRALRRLALRTLLDSGKVSAARRVCDVHEQTDLVDHFLVGRLLELEGLPLEAADAFVLARDASAAASVLRRAAAWESAAPILDQIPEEEALRLRWLLEATDLAARRPNGLVNSLSPREQQRLRQLVLGVDKGLEE